MFVCFEGIDGAGKTTQARMLLQRLQKDGVVATLVADPGTTQIGTAIRQILLQNDAPISSAAQMLLFSAARAELAAHVAALLAADNIVICDRWLLSTLVYQGEINNVNTDLILKIFEATSAVQPDICFLLDLDPEEAVVRMERRSEKPSDRYERRCIEDRQRMRAAYLRHAQERPYAKTVHVVSAALDPLATHERICNLVYKVISHSTESKDAGHARNNDEKERTRTSTFDSQTRSPSTRKATADRP
ncbi:dTMP kinase [bacterium]|nr:dTMP kinase [bacterium]